MYAANFVRQFMHDTINEHLKAALRILKYMKVAPGQSLYFRKNKNRDIQVFRYADWAGSKADMQSTSDC